MDSRHFLQISYQKPEEKQQIFDGAMSINKAMFDIGDILEFGYLGGWTLFNLLP